MSLNINLMIVDDHPVVRDSLMNLLYVHDSRIKVVAHAGNVNDALLLGQQYQPDIVLTDLQMSPLNGIDLIVHLRKICPDIRYVVFTAFTAAEYILQAFDAGAQAFVSKDMHAQELIKAIDAVTNGATYYPAELKQALKKRQEQPQMTPREREVLGLIAQGLTSKQIARKLSIDSRTVDVHRANIRQRFDLDSGAALMRFAIASTSSAFS
jgi:two-component system nitrate/nitrite response regulator NarL